MNTTALGITPALSDACIDPLLQSVKNDQSRADQLAVDASRLLATSKDRLGGYKDAGFMKRLWFAFVGKNGALQRATTSDLVELQGIAQECLAALQKQNLISTNAIAITINNLRQLGDRVEQLSDLTLAFAQRTSAALNKLQQDGEVTRWLAMLAKQPELKNTTDAMKVVVIAYRYAKIITSEGNGSRPHNSARDLADAFQQIELPPEKEISLLEFGTEIASSSFKGAMNSSAFVEIVTVAAGTRIVSASEVAMSVPGPALACVGGIAAALPQLQRYVDRSSATPTLFGEFRRWLKRPVGRQGIGWPQREANMTAVHDILLAQVESADTRYTLLGLAEELIAGVAIACELMRPVEPVAEIAGEISARVLSVDQVLARQIPVKTHALMKFKPTPSQVAVYLDWLVLTGVVGELTDKQTSFLVAIAKAMHTTFDVQHANKVVSAPETTDFDKVRTLLSDRERQYIWLVDATYLAAVSHAEQIADEQISSATRIFDFVGDSANDFCKIARVVSTSTNAQDIVQNIRRLSRNTEEWKTVLDFRKISFHGAFDFEKDRCRKIRSWGANLCCTADELISSKSNIDKKKVKIKRSLDDEFGLYALLSGYGNMIEYPSAVSSFDNEVEAFVVDCNAYLLLFDGGAVEFVKEESGHADGSDIMYGNDFGRVAESDLQRRVLEGRKDRIRYCVDTCDAVVKLLQKIEDRN